MPERAGAPDGGGRPQAAPGLRRFACDGRDWVVWIAGRGLSGNADLSPAPVQLARFALADSPDRPLREAVIAPCRLDELHETELTAILTRAKAVPEVSEDPPVSPEAGPSPARDTSGSSRRKR